MGWLRSCRMAFVEGMDVLYSRNTFEFQCKKMSLDVRYYLPGQDFSRITSIRWRIQEHGHGSRLAPRITIASQEQLARLEHLLCAISTSMPNLRKIYLAFLWMVNFWPEEPLHFKRTYQLYKRDVLPLLDRMARARRRSRLDMEIAVPGSVFYPYWHAARERGLKFQWPDWPERQDEHPQAEYCARRRVWRSCADSADDKLEEASRNEARVKDDSGVEIGYWISRAGHDGLPAHFENDYRHLQPPRPGSPERALTWEEEWEQPCTEDVRCPNIFDCVC